MTNSWTTQTYFYLSFQDFRFLYFGDTFLARPRNLHIFERGERIGFRNLNLKAYINRVGIKRIPSWMHGCTKIFMPFHKDTLKREEKPITSWMQDVQDLDHLMNDL